VGDGLGVGGLVFVIGWEWFGCVGCDVDLLGAIGWCVWDLMLFIWV
jgi:hypothetical protein